jgi:serine/threonine protein kinase
VRALQACVRLTPATVRDSLTNPFPLREPGLSERQLAHYDITSKLGEGGMGAVFRARDTKLDREVALKFLPDEVAGDPERMARFRREARVLASLNHPNIAGIHGLEEAEGKSFLVMELADGEDLAARLQRGPVPVGEAVEIAAQIAAGLEEAHENGVVHRDLKPANVMVSASGDVKILDFGLARAYVGDSVDEGDLANSPTITAAMTQMGTILGTAAYMSPEQAKGRGVDRRADIWSFGVVLYEMLTGDAPFAAETISETVAAVLMRPLDLSQLPHEVPASLRNLLERCLERDPRKRLRDIGEARILLQDPAGSVVLSASSPLLTGATSAASSSGTARTWLPWTLAGILALALAVILLRGGAESGGETLGPLTYSSLEAPGGSGFHLSGTNPAQAQLAPDGTKLVYGARTASASPDLWLQDLSSPTPRRLPGTTGASYHFWSPDSQSLGFYSSGALHVMDLATETRRQIAAVSGGKGGCWTPDNQILFTASSSTPISRLDLETGEITELTDLNAEPVSNSHRHPRWLTDERFLFVARLSDPSSGSPVAIMVGNLDGSPPVELMRADGQAEYVDGHLLYLSESNLIARPLDVNTLEFTGAPRTLASDVGRIPGAALSLFSVSTNGNLVFHPGYSSTLTATLAWFDVEGNRLGQASELETIGNFAIAPDQRTVAVELWGDRTGLADIWLYDLETGVPTRLTFGTGSEFGPRWSSDGETLYYCTEDGDEASIMAVEPESRAEPRIVFTMPGLARLSDVSPDGRWLSVVATDSVSGFDQVYLAPVDGSSAPLLVDSSAETSLNARFAPDGRWIAYALADDGVWKLYLKTNPPTSRKWQLTDQDAFWYDWSPGGDRIYFQWAGSELFVTDVDLTGSAPKTGQTRVVSEQFPNPVTNLHDFAVSADGETFFVTDAGSADDARPVRLVQNWPRLLGRMTGRQ